MDGIQIAGRLSGGRFLQRLADAIQRVSDAVIATGEKGSVAVTLTIEQPQSGVPMVTVSERIAAKPPVRKGEGGVFFVHEGQLHARDPRQAELPLHLIESGATEVRTVDEATGEIRRVAGED